MDAAIAVAARVGAIGAAEEVRAEPAVAAVAVVVRAVAPAAPAVVVRAVARAEPVVVRAVASVSAVAIAIRVQARPPPVPAGWSPATPVVLHCRTVVQADVPWPNAPTPNPAIGAQVVERAVVPVVVPAAARVDVPAVARAAVRQVVRPVVPVVA
jgi:hypothetical protein